MVRKDIEGRMEPCILPDCVFDLLEGYTYSTSITRDYPNREKAIQALREAIAKASSCQK